MSFCVRYVKRRLRGDVAYNAKNAIADLGFIDAWSRMHGDVYGKDEVWFESYLECLEITEGYSDAGYLLTNRATPEELAKFLWAVGFLRGSLWNSKIPYAVSEMFKNIIAYVSEHHEYVDARPEPEVEMLSDHQRDELLEKCVDGGDICDPDFIQQIDATDEAIARFSCQEIGVGYYREAIDEIGKRRAEQAACEANQERPPETMSHAESEPVAAFPEYRPVPRSEYCWTQEEKDRLVKLRSDHPDWTWNRIGEEMGLRGPQCNAMYHNMRRNGLIGIPKQEVPSPEPDAEPDPVAAFLARGGQVTKLPARTADGALSLKGFH